VALDELLRQLLQQRVAGRIGRGHGTPPLLPKASELRTACRRVRQGVGIETRWRTPPCFDDNEPKQSIPLILEYFSFLSNPFRVGA
jgi:hypothetical protein